MSEAPASLLQLRAKHAHALPRLRLLGRWGALLILELGLAGDGSQVRAVVRLVNVESILVVVSEALANEFLASVRNLRLLLEDHLPSIEDCLVPYNRHLRLVLSEGLHPIEQLVKDDAHRPNIYFGSDLRIILLKTLRCLVPVSAHPL